MNLKFDVQRMTDFWNYRYGEELDTIAMSEMIQKRVFELGGGWKIERVHELIHVDADYLYINSTKCLSFSDKEHEDDFFFENHSYEEANITFFDR